MPRMKAAGNEKKVKFGTQVDPGALDRLRRLSQKAHCTLGETIGRLSRLALYLDPEVASEIAAFCDERAAALDGEAAALPHDGSEELAASRKRLQASQMRDFRDLMRDLGGGAPETRARETRRIGLQGGDAAEVPVEWVVLNEEEAAGCTSATVIEVAGGAPLGAPHFVFLHDGAGGISDADRGRALDLATAAWPEMAEVAARENAIEYDADGMPADPAKYRDTPRIGFFPLLDAEAYGSMGGAPCGAQVHRARIQQGL